MALTHDTTAHSDMWLDARIRLDVEEERIIRGLNDSGYTIDCRVVSRDGKSFRLANFRRHVSGNVSIELELDHSQRGRVVSSDELIEDYTPVHQLEETWSGLAELAARFDRAAS